MANASIKQITALAAICVLAFVLRALVIANTAQVGIFADMQAYHERAVHLVKTGALWRDAFRVPGFSIFLAGIYKAFGESLVAARVGQAIVGVLTVIVTYLLARRVATARGALAAALVVAVYPALLLYSVYLMAETLFAFLALLAIALWLERRPWVAFLAGLVLGAATLTRSLGLAVLSGIVLAEVWEVVRDPRRARPDALRVVSLMIGFALVLAPWVQRNYAVYHRFVPTETASGFQLVVGNYPRATGRHPGIPEAEATLQAYGRGALNDLEVSDRMTQAARQFVIENPGAAARLAMLKVGYLLGLEGREHAWGYSYFYQGRREARTVWAWGIALIVSFPLLMIAASIGLWRPGLTATHLGLLIVTTLASVTMLHIVSFGESRFHLPWIPLLAILAARAFSPLDRKPWTRPRLVGLAVWLVCLALVWTSQAPELIDVLPKLAASPTPLQLPY